MSLLALPGHCPLPTPTTSCAPPLMGHSWTFLLLSFFVSIYALPILLFFFLSGTLPCGHRVCFSLRLSSLFVFFSPLCAWGQMYGWVSVDWLGLVLWCGMSQDVRGCREDNAHLHTPHGPWALPSTVCSHISPFQHHTSKHTLSRSPPNILFHRVASNSSSVRNICSADTPQWKRVALRIALGFYSTKAAKQINSEFYAAWLPIKAHTPPCDPKKALSARSRGRTVTFVHAFGRTWCLYILDSLFCVMCSMWVGRYTVSNRRCLCKSEEHDWVDQTAGVGRG